MPTFMLSMNFTDQGIRGIKEAPKRAEAARDLGKKLGVEVKHLYLTSGESDLVAFVDTPSGDNVAKFALALGSLGNVRTRTARVWPADEYMKLISELPSVTFARRKTFGATVVLPAPDGRNPVWAFRRTPGRNFSP